MASYAMWAILGVAFFQFGAGIAEERATAWERFLRTLRCRGSSGWPGGCCRRRCSAAAAAAVVIAEAHLINPRVAADRWLPWILTLAAGGGWWPWPGSPWATGPARGRPRRWPPWPGCCWPTWADCGPLPPSSRAGRPRSPYLPTRLWGELTWAAVQGQATSLGDWLGLAAWAVGFAVLALWGYRRDEDASYR